MKYSVQKLKQAVTRGEVFEYIGFWGKHSDNDLERSLSNFYVAPFTYTLYNGVEYTFDSVEQFYVYKKALHFEDYEALEKILINGKHSAEYKNLGRSVRGFEDKSWNKVKESVLVEGIKLKFTQNEDLKTLLLSTKGKVLVETSPMDKTFGTCVPKYTRNGDVNPLWNNPQNWLGRNLLGFALMELRDELESELN